MRKKLLWTLPVLALAFVLGSAIQTHADTSRSGRGWLWGGSENPDRPQTTVVSGNETGVDGIMLNGVDKNDAVIPGITDWGDKAVDIPFADGPVTGYAWWGHGNGSADGDWLDFAPTADALPAGETNLCGGSMGGVCRQGNSLVGWARFVGIKNDLAKGNSGGWEGWVKMHNVTIDTAANTLSGYGWNGEKNLGGGLVEGLGWIDFSNASMVAPRTLKVCQDACNSDIEVTDAGFTMQETDPARNYKACYNTATSCNASGGPNDGDVTSDAKTTWSEKNAPGDAIGLSGSNPKTITPKDISGVSSVQENVGVEYDTLSEFVFPVTNVCVKTGDWVTGPDGVSGGVIDGDYLANICSSETVTGYNNSCGLQSQPFNGLKNCNAGTNWKEVAP
jgi:hypothetical protein